MIPTDPEPPWQLLPWDTSFFGFTVARINKLLSAEEFKHFMNWRDEHRVVCAYYECPVHCINAIQIAMQEGFQLVDVRVLLENPSLSDEPNPVEDPFLRPACAHDLPMLQALAAELHSDTRFFADTRFPTEKARELYALWMKKDCGQEGGIVWVKVNREDQLIGYLTCHHNQVTGTIGLFGVASAYQGQGVGKALLKQGLYWFKQQNCQRVHVITQGRNTGALASYTSNGFRIKSLSVWLHLWSEQK